MIPRLFLRGSGLGAKFLLVLAISDVLGLHAMAVYGIAVAVSVVASKLLGLGFSSEINRQLSAGECGLGAPARSLVICTAVAVAAGTASVFLAPAWSAELSHYTAAVVAATAVTEYVSFEINTLVFSAHQANTGAMLMFVKTGAWAILACAGLWGGLLSDIEQVLYLWILANLIVIAGGAVVLARTVANSGPRVALAGILAKGFPFYVSAVFIALTQYIDRFILARFVSSEDVGRYVLSWSVTNVIQTLTYAVVAVVALPSLAKAAKQLSNPVAARRIFLNRWVARSIALSGALFIALIAALWLAHRLQISKPPLPGLLVSAILGAAFVVRSASDVIFGGLIASGYRKASFVSSTATLLVSVVLYFWLIGRYGVLGAAMGFMISALFSMPILYLTLKTTRSGNDPWAS